MVGISGGFLGLGHQPRPGGWSGPGCQDEEMGHQEECHFHSRIRFGPRRTMDVPDRLGRQELAPGGAGGLPTLRQSPIVRPAQELPGTVGQTLLSLARSTFRPAANSGLLCPGLGQTL